MVQILTALHPHPAELGADLAHQGLGGVELVVGGSSTVRVVSDAPLAESAVRDAVDEAGYTLVGTT